MQDKITECEENKKLVLEEMDLRKKQFSLLITAIDSLRILFFNCIESILIK